MAQIIRITSEALQATIRRLLPSQQGFGEDLQASNVIMPVIDVTPTAEGSQLRTDLAKAMSADSNTAFNVNGSNTTIINTTGFYELYGVATIQVNASAGEFCQFVMNSPSGSSNAWVFETASGVSGEIVAVPFTGLVVYLRTGDTFNAQTSSNCILAGSYRQIADIYGNVVNPTGFTFE